jgi:hypothetical protein
MLSFTGARNLTSPQRPTVGQLHSLSAKDPQLFARDRWFESISLQRRVNKLSVPRVSTPRLVAPPTMMTKQTETAGEPVCPECARMPQVFSRLRVRLP